MLTPAYIRTMAAYNAEMNRRLYGAAARLGDAERRGDGGAFWISIHGTFNHLLWGDLTWMSRFAGWPAPAVPIKESGRFIDDFGELRRRRAKTDADILAWSEGVSAAWLGEDQSWFSAAAERPMRAPRALLVAHFFNHQAHHRGQAHALLTRAGQDTGDTDLLLIVPTLPP